MGPSITENGQPAGQPGSTSFPIFSRPKVTCPVPDDAVIALRVPWQLVIDVKFNGGWDVVNPETGEREFNATGSYTFTHRIEVGPCSMRY